MENNTLKKAQTNKYIVQFSSYTSSWLAAARPLEYSQARLASGRQQKEQDNKGTRQYKDQRHYTVENAPEVTLQAHKATCFLTCIIALVLWKDFEITWSLMKSCTGSLAAQPCPIQYLHGEVLSGILSLNAGAHPSSSYTKGTTCLGPVCSFRHARHTETEAHPFSQQ